MSWASFELQDLISSTICRDLRDFSDFQAYSVCVFAIAFRHEGDHTGPQSDANVIPSHDNSTCIISPHMLSMKQQKWMKNTWIIDPFTAAMLCPFRRTSVVQSLDINSHFRLPSSSWDLEMQILSLQACLERAFPMVATLQQGFFQCQVLLLSGALWSKICQISSVFKGSHRIRWPKIAWNGMWLSCYTFLLHVFSQPCHAAGQIYQRKWWAELAPWVMELLKCQVCQVKCQGHLGSRSCWENWIGGSYLGYHGGMRSNEWEGWSITQNRFLTRFQDHHTGVKYDVNP